VIEVFPLPYFASQIDGMLNEAAFYLLILLLLVSLGMFALQRLDGFHPESKINQVIVFTIFISLWPQVMMGMKEIVDVFNTFLIRQVFQIPWRGFESIGAVVWERVEFKEWIGDAVFNTLGKLLAYVLDVARLLLYYLFVLWFFFYKLMGPLILARGVLSHDLSVLKDLLSEVSVLFLWQTTFVFLLGFFGLAMKGVV